MRIISKRQLKEIVLYSPQHIARLEKAGKFPKGRLNKVTAGAATTRFLYDGDELVAEYASNGSTILNRFVHGAGVDDPLVWYQGSALTDKRYLIADERGSITTVTNAAGSVLKINTYDGWGIPQGHATGTTTDDNLGRFQYTGQIWLPEIDMYYYKARIYSPNLGRFMQTDPIGYEDGMNMYAYVTNDPINGNDPTGQSCEAADDGDAGAYCDRDNPQDDGPPIVVTGVKPTKRPTMVEQAEMTMSLPVDRDGGSGARAGAALVILSDRISEQRAAGASLGSAIVGSIVGVKKVVTPTKDLARFEKLPGNQGFRDKKNGLVFQADRGNQTGGSNSGSAHGGGQWKVKDRNGNVVASVYNNGTLRKGSLPSSSFKKTTVRKRRK